MNVAGPSSSGEKLAHILSFVSDEAERRTFVFQEFSLRLPVVDFRKSVALLFHM